MILVTGASGTVGRAVLDALSNSGQPIKALFRKPSDAAKAGSVATAVADFSDQEGLKRALSGADTVFLVCSPVPNLVELEEDVIRASKSAGVKHIVKASALGAGDYAKSFPSWHRAVEEKLKASGLGFTIIRPNSFMQNILAYNAPSIRAQGAFYSALGKSKTSYIDVRDVGAAAAKALASPGEHAGKVYELNGPEAVSSGELAGRISKVAGREIKYVEIPEAAQEKAMLDLGMPQWQVTAVLELQQYYTGGKGGEVTDVLSGLLGRAPIRLDQFLAENRESFRAN